MTHDMEIRRKQRIRGVNMPDWQRPRTGSECPSLCQQQESERETDWQKRCWVKPVGGAIAVPAHP